MPEPEPTLVACLTPPGAGAIATLGVRGPRAWEAARRLFRPASRALPERPAPGAFWFGRFGSDEFADEVVLCLREWEPVPHVEVHCHGGAEVVRWLTGLLAEQGCVPVEPSRWLRATPSAPSPPSPLPRGERGERAPSPPSPLPRGERGEICPSPPFPLPSGERGEICSSPPFPLPSGERGEICSSPPVPFPGGAGEETSREIHARAVEALTKARTLRTASILLDQVNGAFTRALSDILAALEREDLTKAANLLDELCRFAPVGRHLLAPWRVAIAGPPNVGKSSLLNALSGYERAIVAPTAGTTRDVVTATLAFDGFLFELSDTAGIREAGDELEGQGVERARGLLRDADLCVWLLDASADPVWPDASVPAERLLLVRNKIDLPPAWPPEKAPGAVGVSARTGEGVPVLIREIVGRLVPHVPPEGAPVPFLPELADRVEEAARRVREGRGAAARAVLLGAL